MSLSSESSISIEPTVWPWARRQNCCRPVCRMKWLKNKGAVLIALWSFLVIHVYFFLEEGMINEKKSEDPQKTPSSGIILICIALLFPIGGWLADTRLGRYKTVRYSMWIMWLCAILATLGEILGYVSVTYNDQIKVWVFRALFVVMAMGLGGFQSNIIQLGTDQLIDASANEISSFIFWYVLLMNLSGLSLSFISECVAQEYSLFSVKTLMVTVCLTLAISSDFLLQGWLVEERVVKKSLREVLKIIWYAIKNRRSRYEFADDDDEDKLPSQFDIAKHQYGGPFSAHQVENVRTFLWMLVILSTCGIVYGSLISVEYAREKVQHRWRGYGEMNGLIGCYKTLFVRHEDGIVIVLLCLSYELIIRPFFNRFLPKLSIVNKFIVGTGLFLALILCLLSIEAVAFNKESVMSNNSVECIFSEKYPEVKVDQKWLLIPDIFGATSHFVLDVTAIEFIWAQTPSTMKGLMFGCGYAILGLSTLLHGSAAVPFIFSSKIRTFNWYPLSCGIWYFIMEGGITLVMLIAIVVLVKCYKKRK